MSREPNGYWPSCRHNADIPSATCPATAGREARRTPNIGLARCSRNVARAVLVYPK
jgi:hypothetical protein